jgi:hypothetical protein
MALYLRALRGEPDPTEFDHRLALLSRQVEATPADIKSERSTATLAFIALHFAYPLINELTGGARRMNQSLFSRRLTTNIYTDPTGIENDFSVTTYGGPITNASTYAEHSQIPEGMMNGEWQRVHGIHKLTGFKLDPGAEISIEYNISAGPNDIFVSTKSGNTSVNKKFNYANPPSETDALDIARITLSNAMIATEALCKKADDTSGH